MMTTDIVVRGSGGMAAANSTLQLPQVIEIAGHFVRSGMFKDASDVSKAVVKILAGQEIGIGPFTSMQEIDIIQGQVALSANIQAAKVRESGRYDYRVRELTNDRASIEFFDRGESIGVSSFTMEDAKKAGLSGKTNWQQYARNMLFSRCMSNGVAWYCPEVTVMRTYTREELGSDSSRETAPEGADIIAKFNALEDRRVIETPTPLVPEVVVQPPPPPPETHSAPVAKLAAPSAGNGVPAQHAYVENGHTPPAGNDRQEWEPESWGASIDTARADDAAGWAKLIELRTLAAQIPLGQRRINVLDKIDAAFAELLPEVAPNLSPDDLRACQNTLLGLVKRSTPGFKAAESAVNGCLAALDGRKAA